MEEDNDNIKVLVFIFNSGNVDLRRFSTKDRLFIIWDTPSTVHVEE